MAVIHLVMTLLTVILNGQNCKELHRIDYQKARQNKEQVLWFATWCKPCMHKILELTPEKFAKTKIIGTHDTRENIQRAYKFFLDRHSTNNNHHQQCFFDKDAVVASLFKIDDFHDSKK